MPPDFPHTARPMPVPVPCPCTWSRAGPAPVDIGSRDAGPHVFFQKNTKSFMRGYFKGPNENAVDFFLTGQACRSSPWPQNIQIRTFFLHKKFAIFQGPAAKFRGPTSKMGLSLIHI